MCQPTPAYFMQAEHTVGDSITEDEPAKLKAMAVELALGINREGRKGLPGPWLTDHR